MANVRTKKSSDTGKEKNMCDLTPKEQAMQQAIIAQGLIALGNVLGSLASVELEHDKRCSARRSSSAMRNSRHNVPELDWDNPLRTLVMGMLQNN